MSGEKPVEFNKIYDRYYRKIVNYIYYKIGNKSDSEELAQDTFAKVYKNLKYYNRDSGTIYNFIIANCNQILSEYYRKSSFRRDVAEEVELDENIASDIGINDSVAYDLLYEIDKLPDDQKEAFKLVYIKKLSYKDTSRIMGKSESSVKSLIFRAKRTLRSEIVKKDPEIGRRYGFKEGLKILLISAACFTLIGGFTYAMIRLYKESFKKETYTLTEVFTDVPDENSNISREKATEKMNEYLEILGVDDRVDSEDIHLIMDYELLKECWKVENDDYILEIDAEEGKILCYTSYNPGSINDLGTYDEKIKELNLIDGYSLYNSKQNGEINYYEYAKKYGDVYNLYQKITVISDHNRITTIWVLDYDYDDKEVKISKEEAIEIAEKQGIDISNIDLTIEQIIMNKKNVSNTVNTDIDEYNNIINRKNFIILKVWKVMTKNDHIILIDSNTGDIYADLYLDGEYRGN